MTLTVHIERLVVDAAVAGDAAAIAAAVTAALGARFAGAPHPDWWRGGTTPALATTLPPRGAPAERIGGAVAAALAAGPPAESGR